MSQPVYECVRVYYPRGLRTGGPEALHQLVDSLRGMGVDAALTPLPGTEHEDRVPAYAAYNAPEDSVPAHSTRCAVVVPETWLPPFLSRHRDLYYWWLSVDNSALFSASRAWRFRRESDRSTSRLLLSRTKEQARRVLHARALTSITHLAQSTYAERELASTFNVRPQMLSDYTTLPIVDRKLVNSTRPVVAFNPRKGAELIRQVREQLGHSVEWLALESLNREQLVTALLRTDIYLELGHQPGKDRLPREAAASGALVLGLQRGAGAVEEDMPIPMQHKIADQGDIVASAIEVMRHVLVDLQSHQSLQAPYRLKIAMERDVFEGQVRSVFDRCAPAGKVLPRLQ